jgi:hypothetical protein
MDGYQVSREATAWITTLPVSFRAVHVVLSVLVFAFAGAGAVAHYLFLADKTRADQQLMLQAQTVRASRLISTLLESRFNNAMTTTRSVRYVYRQASRLAMRSGLTQAEDDNETVAVLQRGATNSTFRQTTPVPGIGVCATATQSRCYPMLDRFLFQTSNWLRGLSSLRYIYVSSVIDASVTEANADSAIANLTAEHRALWCPLEDSQMFPLGPSGTSAVAPPLLSSTATSVWADCGSDLIAESYFSQAGALVAFSLDTHQFSQVRYVGNFLNETYVQNIRALPATAAGWSGRWSSAPYSYVDPSDETETTQWLMTFSAPIGFDAEGRCVAAASADISFGYFSSVMTQQATVENTYMALVDARGPWLVAASGMDTMKWRELVNPFALSAASGAPSSILQLFAQLRALLGPFTNASDSVWMRGTTKSATVTLAEGGSPTFVALAVLPVSDHWLLMQMAVQPPNDVKEFTLASQGSAYMGVLVVTCIGAIVLILTAVHGGVKTIALRTVDDVTRSAQKS